MILVVGKDECLFCSPLCGGTTVQFSPYAVVLPTVDEILYMLCKLVL